MSHFRVGSSRSDILLDLAGNIVHDCFASYWKIKGVKHGICNFHTTRELEALFEIDKEDWGITCESAQVEAKAWQMPNGEWV